MLAKHGICFTSANAPSPYLPSTPGGPPMTPSAPTYLPGTPGGQPMTPGNVGLDVMSPTIGLCSILHILSLELIFCCTFDYNCTL